MLAILAQIFCLHLLVHHLHHSLLFVLRMESDDFIEAPEALMARSFTKPARSFVVHP